MLPNNVRDALAGESTRPRVTRIGDGALITRVISAPSPIRVTRGRVLSPARASRTLLGSNGVAASQSALSLWV